MKSFEFFLPTKIVFEKHALEQAGIYAKQLHMKKPLLIIDRQLMQYSFAKRLLAAFPEADLYAEVEVNPTISSVNHCARFAQRHHNDGMIAMGGGSCMDTAKGACAAAAANTDVGLFLDGAAERMEVPKQILPLIAIPTTSGTGSEVSQYAVLTDEKTLRKDSISSSNICPDVALVDPTLTIGLPKSLTVSYTGRYCDEPLLWDTAAWYGMSIIRTLSGTAWSCSRSPATVCSSSYGTCDGCGL